MSSSFWLRLDFSAWLSWRMRYRGMKKKKKKYASCHIHTWSIPSILLIVDNWSIVFLIFTNTTQQQIIFIFLHLWMYNKKQENENTNIQKEIFTWWMLEMKIHLFFLYFTQHIPGQKKNIQKSEKLFLVAKACLKYFHRHNLTFIYCFYSSSSSSFAFPRASISINF